MADRTPAPVVQTVFREEDGAFSPDGRWMAYVSDESGALEVYVQAFPGGKSKRLVSSGGGTGPRWRADGRELFYLSADQLTGGRFSSNSASGLSASNDAPSVGQHSHLGGPAEADQCCGKSLIGSALVGFSVRQHAPADSISMRARSTTPDISPL
jgi:WD40-like Beta Propeller Repeat